MKGHSYSKNLAVDQSDNPDSIIRVGGSSDPQAVASSIANAFYDRPEVIVRAVGASAVNQSVKAIAIARGYVAPKGRDLVCRPGFTNIESDDDSNESISAISLRLTLL